jgi:hypothetical protein
MAEPCHSSVRLEGSPDRRGTGRLRLAMRSADRGRVSWVCSSSGRRTSARGTLHRDGGDVVHVLDDGLVLGLQILVEAGHESFDVHVGTSTSTENTCARSTTTEYIHGPTTAPAGPTGAVPPVPGNAGPGDSGDYSHGAPGCDDRSEHRGRGREDMDTITRSAAADIRPTGTGRRIHERPTMP